jgi:glycine cleavage system regulatory protein
MSGDDLFRAQAVLQVPREISLESLQGELEQLADDLIVELRDSGPGG